MPPAFAKASAGKPEFQRRLVRRSEAQAGTALRTLRHSILLTDLNRVSFNLIQRKKTNNQSQIRDDQFLCVTAAHHASDQCNVIVCARVADPRTGFREN